MVAYHNIIRYRPQGAGYALDLSLDGDWVMSAGIKPDVNSATVSHREFDKLDLSGDREGRIEFYFGQGKDGTGASHTIDEITLVEIEPLELGIPAGGSSSQARIVRYRLHFADKRHKLVSPRGGHLRLGMINTPNASKKYQNRELAIKCLEAMGLIRYASIDNLPNQPEQKNLEWRGNHAPTELAKVLDGVDAVLALQSNGGIDIRIRGEGDTPSFPAAFKLADLPMSLGDRRGKVVVFSSAPNAIVNTKTLTGPHPDRWEFVAQNKKKQWVRLAEVDYIGLSSPYGIVRTGFLGVEPAYRALARSQFYRCIRLNPEKHKYTVLRRVFENPSQTNITSDLQVMAKTITAYEGAVDYASYGIMDAVPVGMFTDAANGRPVTVLQTRDVMGTFAGGITNRVANLWHQAFRELVEGELSVRFSYEEQEDLGGGEVRPKYFEVGYRLGQNNEPVKLTDDELKNAMLDANTMVIAKPEWRLIKIEGDATNRTTLEAEAKAIADQYLRGSNQQPRKLSAIGYHAVELSGRVSRIIWSQSRLMTEATVDEWHAPRDAKTPDEWRKFMAGDAKHPQQAAYQAERMGYGAEGSQQPVVMMRPAVSRMAQAAQLYPCYLRNAQGDGGSAGFEATWTYDVYDMDGTTKLENQAVLYSVRPKLKLFAAPEDSIGFYTFDKTGVRRLIWANEVVDWFICVV